MRLITRSSAFRKDYKRLQKRGFEISRLLSVIDAIANGQTLEDRYRDHPFMETTKVGASAMLLLTGCWFTF